jgi:hypothetical protein
MDNPFAFAEKFGVKVKIPSSVEVGPFKTELSLGVCDCMVSTMCKMQLDVHSAYEGCRKATRNNENPYDDCLTCCEKANNNVMGAGYVLCSYGC